MKQKNLPLYGLTHAIGFLGGLSAVVVLAGLFNHFVWHRGFYEGVELAIAVYCTGPIGNALGRSVLASQKAEEEKRRK